MGIFVHTKQWEGQRTMTQAMKPKSLRSKYDITLHPWDLSDW
jgi:hypothetical protein